MTMLALARPHWDRSLRHPVGVFAVLVLPMVLSAVALAGPAQLERWWVLVVLGWGLAGLLPPALAAFANDQALSARYAALPIGPADRLMGAFAGLLPVALCGSGLLALAALGLGPSGLRHPLLLSVAALAASTHVLWGLAIAAWCRSAWSRAGALGLMLLALFGGVVAGPQLPWLAWAPSALAKASLVALAQPEAWGRASWPLGLLALSGLGAALLALIGLQRRA
jgi:hypothetical protein